MLWSCVPYDKYCCIYCSTRHVTSVHTRCSSISMRRCGTAMRGNMSFVHTEYARKNWPLLWVTNYYSNCAAVRSGLLNRNNSCLSFVVVVISVFCFMPPQGFFASFRCTPPTHPTSPLICNTRYMVATINSYLPDTRSALFLFVVHADCPLTNPPKAQLLIHTWYLVPGVLQGCLTQQQSTKCFKV